MIPTIVANKKYKLNTKYFLLEEGDILKKGDQWYNPIKNKWEAVTDGEPDEEGNYPDAFIGYGFSFDESKPVRRKNKDYK